ncbi:MAG: branched-chain amino acid ABC transporter permease, partial [Clostridiales bacterium]|nr:branched-chain amino acid ABC transporter permease [Clostridiales bacterium]
VSAFLAGMAGALYGLNYSSLDAAKFNFNTSINILVFVVLGGMGNILGSVISATVLYILPEAMRGLANYRMIIYAVVLILVMLFTWSPKMKELNSVVMDKIRCMFKKEKQKEAQAQ